MLSAALASKSVGGFSAGVLLAVSDGKDAFGSPGYQVWRRAPCGYGAGRRRRNNAVGDPRHQVQRWASYCEAAG